MPACGGARGPAPCPSPVSAPCPDALLYPRSCGHSGGLHPQPVPTASHVPSQPRASLRARKAILSYLYARATPGRQRGNARGPSVAVPTGTPTASCLRLKRLLPASLAAPCLSPAADLPPSITQSAFPINLCRAAFGRLCRHDAGGANSFSAPHRRSPPLSLAHFCFSFLTPRTCILSYGSGKAPSAWYFARTFR